MELSTQASAYAAICMRPFAAVALRPLVKALLKAYDTVTGDNKQFVAVSEYRASLAAAQRGDREVIPMSDDFKEAALRQRIDANAVPHGLPWSAAVQMIVDMAENRIHSALSREYADHVHMYSTMQVRRELTGGEMRAIMSTLMFPGWFAEHDEAARQILCNYNLFERMKVEPNMVVTMAQATAVAADRYLTALKAEQQRPARRRPARAAA